MTVLNPDPEPIDLATAEDRRSGAGRRLVRNPFGLTSLVILAAMVLLGLFAPLISAHDPNLTSLTHVSAPVGSPGYLLGGDVSGRDILARVLASINVSVISALIGGGVAIVLGTLFGLIAGYTAKRTDAALSWIFNLLMTFPALVLIIVLFPLTGGSYQSTMALFGIFLAPGIFRLVRNLVVGVRNELYVDAAKVSGLSTFRILSRHVFYVVRGPIIISGAFLAGAAIGVQAGLAFLGLGSNSVPSFGSMTSDAFTNIYTAPLQMVWPSLGLALLTGSLVLLGNAYRDALTASTTVTKRSAKTERLRMAQEGARPKSAGEATASPPTTTVGGLLSVQNLRVSYPATDGMPKAVVDGISFAVGSGEIVGLVGESGSGKTQTAFSILGLLPAEAIVSASELALTGESLLGARSDVMRRLRGGVVAYIPQEPMSNLDPSFTVGSQLVEGLLPAMSRKEAKQTVLSLLDRVGIKDPQTTFRSYPHQISGGMAQRVLIAGAVAGRPKLLIADEPTTALDVTVQAEILDLLRDLQAEFGMAVVLVTHNFGVVADLCDRVMVMKSGRIVESGTVRDIFQNPQDAYTKALLGAILDDSTVRADLQVQGSKTAAGATGR